MAEYFDLALRFSTLANFFASVPPLVTSHKLCDLAFTFLHGKDRTTIRWIPDDHDFVYFYSRGARAGGASNSLTNVSQGQMDHAVAMLQQAAPGVQQMFRSSQDLAAFLAGVRQTIEQEMVSIRVTGAVVPSQIVRAASAHAAGINLQARAIDYDASWISPALQQWARALAAGPLCDSVVRQFEFEALVCWKTWRVEPVADVCRSASDILAESCGYSSSFPGKRVPFVGMWAGGDAPPLSLSIFGARATDPPSLFGGASFDGKVEQALG